MTFMQLPEVEAALIPYVLSQVLWSYHWKYGFLIQETVRMKKSTEIAVNYLELLSLRQLHLI